MTLQRLVADQVKDTGSTNIINPAEMLIRVPNMDPNSQRLFYFTLIVIVSTITAVWEQAVFEDNELLPTTLDTAYFSSVTVRCWGILPGRWLCFPSIRMISVIEDWLWRTAICSPSGRVRCAGGNWSQLKRNTKISMNHVYDSRGYNSKTNVCFTLAVSLT